MHKFNNTKFHYSNSVREHIILLCDVGAKLNTLKMKHFYRVVYYFYKKKVVWVDGNFGSGKY
jgi:hypothetical protein